MTSEENIYHTADLMRLIQKDHPGYRSSSLYSKIKEMENLGQITRIGKDRYLGKKLTSFDYELESSVARNVDKVMRRSYSEDFPYAIFETAPILNRFLNHLLERNVILLEAPRFFLQHVFHTLKGEGFQNVLLRPSREEVFLYAEDGCILLLPLVSKAPIDIFRKRITIESLGVDILCSPILGCFFEEAEIPTMVEEALSNYKVRFDTLRTYAKRRNALDPLLRTVPETMRALIDDNKTYLHTGEHPEDPRSIQG